MIIDHEKKFVFVHIPKTGGTSVSAFLGHAQRPKNPHHVDPETPVKYASYLRFCFVRNPWERLYSSYNYAQKMAARGILKGDRVRHICEAQPELPFERFVMDFMSEEIVRSSGHFRPQMRWITQAAPQFIGRVEQMASDTAFLCRALGIPARELPHSNRSSNSSYLDVYTPEMLDKVRSLYRRDITALGYGFES
ncbi:MAG: sulfotransferase family 2 domain-containing protein [Sulfitobacter sp.]